MSDRLAKLVYRFRFAVTALVVLGAVPLSPYTDITKIDNDITAWFSREDPAFQEYERFREEFGGTRTLIVAVEGETIFTREGLEFLREASSEIERVPTVERVHSLATANVVQALPPEPGETESAGIEVQPLIDRAGDIDPHEVRARALSDPLIRGDLVSEDGDIAAIVVTFDEDRIDEVRAGVIQQIHQIVDPRLPPGTRAHYNGSLEISETYNRITLENQQKFVPPVVLVTLLAVYALFRSVRKTIITALAIGVSVTWTLGIYALLGFTVNLLTSMLVPLVVVLAIADDVHILQHYDHAMRENGGDRERAFTSTVSHLFVPLLGASGTTALGLLSLATSDVVAVKTFGIGAAIGVMVDFVISLGFVPTLLTLFDPRPQKAPPQETWLMAPLRRVAAFSCARPGLVAGVGLGVALVSALGISRLYVDTNHINFFAQDHPLHVSADVIDRELSGIYSFQVMIDGEPESMRSPEMLDRMERMSERLEALPFVKKVVSLADYVKRVNRELHDGDPAAEIVPDDPQAVAQELFLFSLSDEGRRELESVVASDFSRTQISVKLASMSSDLVFEQIQTAERIAREELAGSGATPTITGAGRLFSTLDHYLVESQVSSFGTAFITVFGVIFLVFRSLRFGLLAIVPNLFPVLAVLGAMGWLGISMNIATVMVASIALGIVDDDTVHFISRFRRETAAGRSVDAAIDLATTHEGRAALTTAFINSCGYGVLMFSEYKPTAWFGMLLGMTMAVAFLAEVFILPATIKLAPRLFGRRQRVSQEQIARACDVAAP